MRIAAITENYTEVELKEFFPGEGIAWTLLRRVEAVPEAVAYFDLDFAPDRHRCEALSRLGPALIIVNAVTETIAELGFPFARINAWPGFLGRPLHELAAADTGMAERVTQLYVRLGRGCRIVPDVPGMIGARILSAVINEAYFTWEGKVSTKEEIDIAMKLGTNYPFGPFEWSKRIGLGRIAGLLRSLSRISPGYTPCGALVSEAGELKYD